MPVYTVEVLASRYRGIRAPLHARRTHALAEDGEVTLCGKIKADDTVETDSAHTEPTCPTCRKRDPRARSTGPFILRSLLQLS